MRGLDGNVALITGGASGLGAAIASRLKSEGAVVVITDLNSALGDQVAAEHGYTFVRHDVRSETDWSAVIARVLQLHLRLDTLVNSAGIHGPVDRVSPEETQLADWREIFAVNVEGVFLGCRAAIAAMRQAGSGSIVNISSVAGLLATPYATAYGASKAAVRQLTRSVAQHCAQESLRIRCNSVHPGNVLTPLWDNLAEQAARIRGVDKEAIVSEAVRNSPMGTFVEPEDVAAAVAFLASSDSRYITGSQLLVDCGLVECDTFLFAGSRGLSH